MTRPGSLSRRLALLISGGFAAIWLLALLATALVLRSEQEEMLDLELRETANVFLPVLSREYLGGRPEAGPPIADPEADSDEILVWILVDGSGATLAQSNDTDAIVRPEGPPEEGYAETRTHVYYTTKANADGLAVRFGDPKIERYEAYRDSLFAFLTPMLAILPLGYLLVGRIAASALRPLSRLRDEIAERGQGRLDPIDGNGQYAELRSITATLNGFIIRLARSLDGERAFASNAAHELRTPVAVALAQAQRLRDRLTGTEMQDIGRIEEALKRMSRLVTRLLQLARADAGLGLSHAPQDISSLLTAVADEHLRDSTRGPRLRLSLPEGGVLSPIDPDAFAIVIANLIDNAFQNAPPGSAVSLSLSPDAVVSVRNEGDPVSAGDLAQLTQRFRRNGTASDGFGLGLHISETIARQAGGTLSLKSPVPGRATGFEAELVLPRNCDPPASREQSRTSEDRARARTGVD